MAKAFRYQHLRSLVPNVDPAPEQLREGEIAVNLAAGKEKMFLKNTDNAVVRFITEGQIDGKMALKVDVSTFETETNEINERIDDLVNGIDCGEY